jgi:hypothetical protein
MKRMRFSIGGLMGFVLVAALGFGGLKAATEYWASGCFTLMAIVLVAAILNAVQGRGKGRAYWSGFAVSGWIYFVLVFVSLGNFAQSYPLLPVVVFEKLEPLIHPNLPGFSVNGSIMCQFSLPTAPPLAPAPPPIPPPLPVPAGSEDGSEPVLVPLIAPVPVLTPPNVSVPLSTPFLNPGLSPFEELTPIHYSRVAHSLTALVVGMLGGLYSAWLFARRERRETNPVAEVSPSSP